MSNKCEPPTSKNVDALGASEAGVNALMGYMKILAPVFIYSYLVPAICSMIFEPQMMMVPGTKPQVTADMTEFEA